MRHALRLLLSSICFLQVACIPDMEVRQTQWNQIAENAIAYGKPKDANNFYAPVGKNVNAGDETMIVLTVKEKFEQKYPERKVIDSKAEKRGEPSDNYILINGVWISHGPKTLQAEKE